VTWPNETNGGEQKIKERHSQLRKGREHIVEGFGGTAAGGKEPERSPGSGVPGYVQASFLLWLAALTAGVAETVVGIIDFCTIILAITRNLKRLRMGEAVIVPCATWHRLELDEPSDIMSITRRRGTQTERRVTA
jgi:hypothetical protein